MDYIKYTAKLDLTDNGALNTGWRIKQGDNGKVLIVIKVVNNNEPYFDEQDIPKIVFHRPDGTSVIGTMTVYSNQSYSYVVIGNELGIAGNVVMDVKFANVGRASTASCIFECVADTIDADAKPADIYPGLTLEEVTTEATRVSTEVATEVAQRVGGSLVLTDSSPLPATDGKKIIGIDAKGRSWQETTQILATVQGGIVPSVGSAINQSVNANNTRCVTNVIYLSIGDKLSITDGFSFYIAHATTANGNIDKVVDWQNPYTITESGFYRFVIKKNAGGDITPSSFVFSGNIAPTPTNPIEIIDASGEVVAISKNLFDKERCVNGYLDGNGNVVSNPQYRVSDYIEVGHSQITISGNKGGNEVICFFAEDKTRVSFFAMGSNNIKTLDVPQTAKYVRCTVAADNLNVYQVEIGTTATSYVPYQSNTITLPYTLRSVGNVADELVVNEDGSGQIVRRVGTYTFNGTESWTWITSDKSAWVEVPQLKKVENYIGSMLCDRFTTTTNHNTLLSAGDGITGYYDSSNKYTTNWIYLRYSSATTLDALKTWLASNPINVYYILATPIETPLTPEEVASIRQLQTYKGTTVIESEMQIDSVTYAGDIKAYIDYRIEQIINPTALSGLSDMPDEEVTEE